MISEMKKNWEVKTLSELTTFLGDGLHGTPKYTDDGDYYFVNGNNLMDGKIIFKDNTKRVSIDEYTKYKKNLTDRTVLVSINGTLGNVAFYNNEKIMLGKSACYFNLLDTVDKKYIKYIISSQYFLDYAHQEATGATIKNVSLKTMRAFKVPLPPLPEQKRIVTLLDTVFSDLEQTRAKTEQNIKNARELFDSYLQQVFSQRGEGWVEKEIGDVADLSRGQNPPKSEFISEPREGYVRFYQIRDGKSDKFAVYVPENSKLHYVNETDILMVAYRHVGNAFRGVKGAFNVALCKIVNKDKEALHDDFLYHLIPSSFIKGELLKVSERSLIPSMSVKHLAQLKIPIPPPHEQDEIVRKINMMEKECNRLEFIYKQKVEAVDELKKSILQKAFSGELTTTAK